MFGYLRALEDGCQVMISIDDDNFPTQDDFVGGHLRNVAFGRPLVDHRRNPHNYVGDLRYEFWGMILTDWLLEILRSSFKPKSSKMTDRVLELAEFLDAEAIKQLPEWCPPEITSFLNYTAKNLRLWSAACVQIGV